jgi:hypothetical protein
MGWFGIGKRDDVIDLTETMRKRHAQAEEIRQDAIGGSESDDNPVSAGLGFLGSIASAATESSEDSTSDSEGDYVDMSAGVSDKRKRLSKRLMDITEKMEDLGNQIYHLQQRIELIERKIGVGERY